MSKLINQGVWGKQWLLRKMRYMKTSFEVIREQLLALPKPKGTLYLQLGLNFPEGPFGIPCLFFWGNVLLIITTVICLLRMINDRPRKTFNFSQKTKVFGKHLQKENKERVSDHLLVKVLSVRNNSVTVPSSTAAISEGVGGRGVFSILLHICLKIVVFCLIGTQPAGLMGQCFCMNLLEVNTGVGEH